MDIDLLLCDRFFASGVSSTLDVFATANLIARQTTGAGPVFSWRVLSRDGGPVASSCGLQLVADGAWDDVRASTAMAFGVGMADESLILEGVRSSEGRELTGVLTRAHDGGATLLASCSSTFLLAETGCLDGGVATTSWWLAPLFRSRYPAIRLAPERLVTEHDRVLCAGAAMAQMDLALHLVRRVGGLQLAHLVARYLVIDDDRMSQGPYMILEHLAAHDEVVARAQGWIREHLQQEVRLDELAQAVGVSPRTLRRKFTRVLGMSPSRYVQRVRAQVAAQLLVSTDWSVGRIAAEVGYAEDGALRRAIREHLDTSPSAIRRRADGR